MRKERMDWLDAQYVDVMMNDGKFNTRVLPLIKADRFATFHRVCGSDIDIIRENLAKNDRDSSFFTEHDRAYVVLSLWKEHGGAMKNNHDTEFLYFRNLAREECIGHLFFQESTDLPKAYFAPIDPVSNEVIEQPIKENQMSATPKFETKHFFNGAEVSTLKEEFLIETIRQLEADIESYKTIKTKSAKIAKKIAELEEGLAKIVEILDSKQ